MSITDWLLGHSFIDPADVTGIHTETIDIYNPPTLTAAQWLTAYGVGLLAIDSVTGDKSIRRRRCTDCRVVLPVVTIDGRLDTFPRCSEHAF